MVELPMRLYEENCIPNSLQSPQKQQNRVDFNEASKVILIPSRKEYRLAGLISSLWWTGSDYFSFQQSANSEVLLLSMYENIDIRKARRILYQPDEENDKKSEMIRSACSGRIPVEEEEEEEEEQYMFGSSDEDDSELALTSPEYRTHRPYKLDMERAESAPSTSFNASPKDSLKLYRGGSLGDFYSARGRVRNGYLADPTDDVVFCVPQKEPGLVCFEPKSTGHRVRRRKASIAEVWKSVGYTVSTSLALLSAACLVVIVLTSRDAVL
jgi:hypothetical protein